MHRRLLLAGISLLAVNTALAFPRGHVSNGVAPPPDDLIHALINGSPVTDTLQNLVNATPTSGTLTLPAGFFSQTAGVPRAMTITGAGKGLTTLSGLSGVEPTGDKACLDFQANGITVSNMTIRDWFIPAGFGGNGAAIRGDGAGIGGTLTNLEITGNQDGILTTSGSWTITNCDFHDNGASDIGGASTHEQYFGADPAAHIVETNVTSACGPLATHAFKCRAGFATLLNSTYTGNSTDPTFGGNAGAVLDVPHCGAFLATTCTFNMPAGSVNPQWLNYGVDSTANSASGMTASFQNCIFNSGLAGQGGIFQAFQAGCTIDVTGSTYTGTTAPTFVGWASVIGTITPATTRNVTWVVSPTGDITNLAPSGALTSVVWSGGTVTATAPALHGVPVGFMFEVNVQDLSYGGGGFSGRFDAISTGANTFTYAVAVNPAVTPPFPRYSIMTVNSTLGCSSADLTYSNTSTCSGTAANNTHIVLATGETRKVIGHVIQWLSNPACMIVAYDPATHIATIAAKAGFPATFTGTPQSGDAYKIFAVNVLFAVYPDTGTNIRTHAAFSPNSGAINFGPMVTSPTCAIKMQGMAAYDPAVPLGIPQSSGSAVCLKNGDGSGNVDHTAVIGIGCANVWLDNLQLWCVSLNAADGLIIAWNGDSFSFPYAVKLTRINGYSEVETADEAHAAFVQIPANATNCNFISSRFGQSAMAAGNSGSYTHCTFVNTQGFRTTTVGVTAPGATTINIASATGFPDGGNPGTVNGRLWISSQNAGLEGHQKTIQSISGTAISVDNTVVTSSLPSGTPVFFGPQMHFGGLGSGPTFKNCAFFGACRLMDGFSGFSATTCMTDVDPQNISGMTHGILFSDQFNNVYLNNALGGTLDARLKVGNNLQGAGTFDSAVPLDIYGRPRSNPPSIGAIE